MYNRLFSITSLLDQLSQKSISYIKRQEAVAKLKGHI